MARPSGRRDSRRSSKRDILRPPLASDQTCLTSPLQYTIGRAAVNPPACGVRIVSVVEALKLARKPRSSLPDEIVQRVVALILDQGLRPGDRLPSERSA